MVHHTRLLNAVRTGAFVARNPKQLAHLAEWTAGRRKEVSLATRPWWVFDAIDWVEEYLDPRSDVLEYGSGASTLWLAQRAHHVYSVEHDRDWYAGIREALPKNVTLRLEESAPQGTVVSDTAIGFFDSYVDAFEDRGEKYYGLVVVDGRARVDCFRAALSKVVPGGMILLDDSDRPKYAEAHTLCDWPRFDFRGLKRGVGMIAQTSCWLRPSTS